MQIDALSPLSSPIPTTSPAGAATQAEEMKQDFLTLLIAQIEQQDPLNPQDPAEFTAQLTQFSSLEQLINISETMNQQIELQAVSLGTAAASFIGKNAEVRGEEFELTSTGEATVRFELPRAASTTTVNIFDAAGNIVRSVELGQTGEGPQDFTWDGKTTAGSDLPPGEYRYEVKATDTDGETIEAQTFVFGRISGVRFQDGIVYLNVGGNEYTMSELRTLTE